MQSRILLSGVFASLSMFSRAEERPNVLFILVDDMQRTSIGGFGNGDVDTPNIDELMGRGVAFSNAHVNGSLSGAVSMPSRAMIMTGRGIFRIQADGQSIPEVHTTLGQHLHENGYDTFGTGKWHSDKKSFNRTFADGDNIFFGGMHRYELNGHVSPRLNHYDATGEYQERAFIADKFSSEMFADAAISYLVERSSENPFFMHVAFTSPHDPRTQHPDYAKSYDWRKISLPENYVPSHPFDNGDLTVRDESILPRERSEEDIKRELAHYYGMINEVDTKIGEVVRALKKSGEYDNTIIIFASDNGLAVGRHGLMGKQNLYEHSFGVPLVIAGGGFEGGTVDDSYCYLYDIYPTLCDVLGIPVPESVEGVSLVDSKDVTEAREDLYLAYSSIQRGLLMDGWKYIIYNVKGEIREQLFNLEVDPLEMNDLSGEATCAEQMSEMKSRLAQRMEEGDDFCDLSVDGWWAGKRMISWNEGIKLYKF